MSGLGESLGTGHRSRHKCPEQLIPTTLLSAQEQMREQTGGVLRATPANQQETRHGNRFGSGACPHSFADSCRKTEERPDKDELRSYNSVDPERFIHKPVRGFDFSQPKSGLAEGGDLARAVGSDPQEAP